MDNEILTISLKKGTKKKLKKVANKGNVKKINGEPNVSKYVAMLIYEAVQESPVSGG